MDTPTPPPEPVLFWNVSDVAKLLQISEQKVRDMVMYDQIPSVKLGGRRMFVPAQIRAWVAQLAAEGGIAAVNKSTIREMRREMKERNRV